MELGNNADDLQFKHAIIDAKGPENPHIKAVGDIDGDGFVDVIIPSSEGGPLVWYQYPGWSKHVIAPSGRWSCDAKLVDMDGDGDLDILISEWYGHDRLEWYENPLPDGNPATDPWKRHIIGSPRAHDIEAGDIDGDGRMEFVTRTQGKDGDHFVIWKREGTAWRQRVIGCPAGEGLALGDVDGDGRLDIVIGGRWYAAPQHIMSDAWEEHVFADWFSDAVVKLADMNGNGRLDVVVTRSEGPGRVAWFESPEDPSARPAVVKLLGKTGPSAVPALIRALKDSSEAVRYDEAADALGDMRASSPEAVSALIRALDDRSRKVRWEAVDALGDMKASSPDAVSALIRALGDVSEDVRERTVEALAEIGAPVQTVVPALIQALSDKSKSVRREAIKALKRLGSPASEKDVKSKI